MKSYEQRARDILAKRDAEEKIIMSKKRKTLRLSVIAAALVAAVTIPLVIVIASKANNNSGVFVPDVTETSAGTNAAETDAAETDAEKTAKREYKDGVIGENTSMAEAEMVDAYPSPSSPSTGKIDKDSSFVYSREKGASEAITKTDDGIDHSASVNAVDAVAGTLTAGEWKDLDNLEDWFKFIEKYNNLVNERKLDTKNVVTVKVKDGENACFNVPVKLLSGDNTVFTGVTDVNGCAYLFYNVDKDGEQPDAVSVGGEKISLDGKKELEVQAAEAGVSVTALDLLLMIDTTGSMGDELEYIKVELKDVVERVAKADQSISIRVSVNFYRDEGDEYVVKYFDFREDVNECTEQLKDQHADGGGDYPEAVHTALDNAVTGHEWRDGAVKLCFIVLDAPPHTEQEIQGVNSQLLKTVKTAAEQGIRIIPVASSGVDEDTEFLLRSYAALTGGTYIFITNDSGIGGDHKEAEVGEHTTEYLNECMIRVACEYCGIYTGEKIPYTPTYRQ